MSPSSPCSHALASLSGSFSPSPPHLRPQTWPEIDSLKLPEKPPISPTGDTSTIRSPAERRNQGLVRASYTGARLPAHERQRWWEATYRKRRATVARAELGGGLTEGVHEPGISIPQLPAYGLAGGVEGRRR
jgi:hypothetical protein